MYLSKESDSFWTENDSVDVSVCRSANQSTASLQIESSTTIWQIAMTFCTDVVPRGRILMSFSI